MTRSVGGVEDPTGNRAHALTPKRYSLGFVVGLYSGAFVGGWLLSVALVTQGLERDQLRAIRWATQATLGGPFFLGEPEFEWMGIVIVPVAAIGLLTRRRVLAWLGCLMVALWTFHGLVAVAMGST